MHKRVYWLLVACLLAPIAQAFAQAPIQERKQVRSEADLPQYRYTPGTATVSELLDGGPALDALAAQVKRNIEATLHDYSIDDPATLRDLYGTLIDLAVLQGDAAALEQHCARYISLLQRPAARLLGCTRSRALLAKPQPPGTDAASAMEQALYQQLADLPWAAVGDDVKQARADTAMPGQRAMLLGMLQQVVEPAYQARGTIDDATARNLLGARINLGLAVPMRDVLVAGYDRYIRQHIAERQDFWGDRIVMLSASERLNPVTIAVWDQGTDLSHFANRLWRNPNEQDNGRDDDGNGFIDDLHGIGFDARQQQTDDLLGTYNDDQGTDEAGIRALTIGRADLEAGIASEAARAFATRVDAITPEQASSLQQAGAAYGFHAHGTAVADVAMRGNPAARLLVVRDSNDLWRVPPPVPSLQQMAKDGDNARRIVDYLEKQQVRVVNISWGATPGDYQGLLEANGVTGAPDELRAQADRLFDAWGTPLSEAIRNAPGVLFVVAAGNAGNDVEFSRGLPESLALPNVLVVGAADRNGQVSGFSSSGTHVRVYANGEQIRTLLPGASAGSILNEGTSIAAPAVTALAGQLFALDPSLDPARAIDLIVRGATPSSDGKQRLIHPKASIALLREQGREGQR